MKSAKQEKSLKKASDSITAYLALGTNVGNRYDNLSRAINLLNDAKRIEVLKCSSIYITKPYGLKEQAEYFNMVIEIATDYSPLELITLLKTSEEILGRIRREKWKEREIDIDILLYDDVIYDDAQLKIPHYDLTNRDFFVIPLLEINRHLKNPVNGKLFSELEFEQTNRYIIGKYSKSIEINLHV